MDEAASVLTGFPLPSPSPTDDLYDTAVRAHIRKIEQLVARGKNAITADNGIQLLNVRTLAVNCILTSL